jgi:acetylglutamate kinase
MTDQAEFHRTAKTLSEALPYMRRFAGETFVIKYGGHAMGDEKPGQSFARNVVLLKQVGINPVVVHGGGPQIGQMLDRLKIQSTFVDGLRVTDQATVEVVEMVLAGSINKQVVTAINQAGGLAIGLSGKDGRLIEARKAAPKGAAAVDLGFVGEPSRINPAILHTLTQSDIIPVIAPIGVGEDGQTYNINADTSAGAIAAALRANKLIMLTDVPGVLDGEKKLVSELTPARARELTAQGVISGGMIPKVETCLEAVEKGVKAAHILDGRVENVLLLEIFTAAGVGTKIHVF